MSYKRLSSFDKLIDATSFFLKTYFEWEHRLIGRPGCKTIDDVLKHVTKGERQWTFLAPDGYGVFINIADDKATV